MKHTKSIYAVVLTVFLPAVFFNPGQGDAIDINVPKT